MPSQRLLVRGSKLNAAIITNCSLGFALLGYDSGVYGGLTTDPRFLAQFKNPNSSLLGFIVSIYLLGCLAGALYCAAYGERVGRRVIMMTGLVIVTIGAILQASAHVLAHMLVARIVAGVGVGFFTAALPVYQGECLHPTKRGYAQAINLTVLIGLGINVAYWLDYGMYYVNSSLSWRFPLAFQCIYSVIGTIFTYFLPESPRWLAAHGREDEALEVLTALREHAYSSDEVQAEFADIKAALKLEEEAGTASWSELFKNEPGVQAFNRVWIGMAAQAMQEFSGSNAISKSIAFTFELIYLLTYSYTAYYSSFIFENSLGLGRKDSLLVSGGLQIFYFFASFVPWYYIDRAGRRKLFIAGAVGMTACLLVSAGCVSSSGHLSTGVVAAIALYFFQAFFTLGWMANLWLYSPELLPLRHRARGNALATSSQWIITFLVVEITPPAINGMGYGIYILFAGLNIIAIPIIWYCFPETAGKSLEEVDVFFAEPTLRKAVKESLRRRGAPQHLSVLQAKAGGEIKMDELAKTDV
ncbi:sugar transporter [Pseudohyphozyma bogoriensis]|nr:sugar transporter [Pseudohyphozyma bogoriensis]